ncbi:glycosyltransferase [Aquisphaera insulae]|uniref:glycosyltransferase n=1 Tax=Aquisphaera insulae TaxID=2712864 RepID=UPI0013ED60D9|nr:glycosyltransferase [Aquisphaera insulae]
MASQARPSDGFADLLGEHAEEGKFLRTHAWIFDAYQQEIPSLLRGLRMERARFEEMAGRPTFSLLATLRDASPRHLEELILSCRCQSYPDWELILVDDGSSRRDHLKLARAWSRRDPRIRVIASEIARGASHAKNLGLSAATGGCLVPIDGDGVLHPMALGLLARHLHEDPAVNLVFTNEMEIDSDWVAPTRILLKPPFDSFTLLRLPYLGRLVAVRRDLVEECSGGGPAFREALEGVEEHDLWLRIARSGRLNARHAALFGYYRRVGSAARALGNPATLAARRRRLLEDHVPRAFPGASWTAKVATEADPLAASSVWITDLPGVPTPRLLIVIPFKDQVETTIQGLESIEVQEHALDVLVVLVNNNSSRPETRPRLVEWLARRRSVRYELLDDHGAFNFARLNNAAIERFGLDRDLLLFMNNDVELSTPCALQVMAMQLLADRTAGFVGIKLHYPGGQGIQHGGVRFIERVHGSGYTLIAHANAAEEFVDIERVSMCVTFACAMTRRETFESLGRLEERFFPNGFGDADICLRALAAGYRHYYLGSVEGTHHESISRGSANEDIEFTCLHERHGGIIAEWRMRHLYHAVGHPWLPSAPQDAASPGGYALVPAGHHGRAPLRYRVADSVVGVMKRLLGPAYGRARSAAVRSAKSLRRLNSRATVYSALRLAIKPIPVLGPASAGVARLARRTVAGGRAARTIAGHLRRDPAAARRLARSFREGGATGLLQDLCDQIPSLNLQPRLAALRFRRSTPSPGQLAALRGRAWPGDAPRFSVVMPVYEPREDWLRQAIDSVRDQTYPNWELICVDDASPSPHVRHTLDERASRDSRMVVVHAEANKGVAAATNRGISTAAGDYIVFMDHDDALEPHALQAFAEAILRDRPDMLYSDEAIAGERLEKVIRVDLRPDFSYDHYLGHPYFVHLVAARAEIVRALGGLHEGMTISQDVDMNLRLVEACESICHVPEVLYRWRTHPGSLGHRKMDECTDASRAALERHFLRTEQRAEIQDRIHFNHRDIRYPAAAGGRIAILVSPSDPRRLDECLAGLERTVDRSLAEVITLDAPKGQGAAARVSEAIAQLGGGYTHYLLLDDSIRASDPGWLEHMLGFADRPDVGVVGPLLLNERQDVEHAGLSIRGDGRVTACRRGSPFRHWIAGRNPGNVGELLASHDVSAVSAACLLTRASVLEELGGFDPRFEAGLHDADYCLRAAEAGYKVILDVYAVLGMAGVGTERHHGVLGRPTREDELRFLERHRARIAGGDPFDPLADDPRSRGPRTILRALPASPRRSRTARVERHAADAAGHGPHAVSHRDAVARRLES